MFSNKPIPDEIAIHRESRRITRSDGAPGVQHHGTGDEAAAAQLYDFTSSDFSYTSPTFAFPYLYDFGLQTFLYYYPDPTNPQRYNTNGVRYFYNFAMGKVVSK